MKVAFVICQKTSAWGVEGRCALVVGETEQAIKDMIPGTWEIDTIIDAEPSLTHCKAQFS